MKVEREVVLGAQPPRADFVVITETDIVDLGLSVFQGFKRYNIIEFKSPDDELSVSVLWKVLGYASFYVWKYGVNPADLTLTLFRGAKPDGIISDPNVKVEMVERGIYRITEWQGHFPIQIVVTTELDGTEYAGFRAISKRPQISDIEQILSEVKDEANESVRGWYRDYLELFSRLDSETLEEAKRRDPDMAKTWREVFEFDKELKENEQRGEQRGEQNATNLINYLWEHGRGEDAKRAGKDKAFFKKLMSELSSVLTLV